MRANKKGITNTARRAEVTIEFAFGLIASALVLMLILGVFNDNVKEMTHNSRFQSLFAKNADGNLANQTKYEQLANDPTQNIIAAAGAPMPDTAVIAQAHAQSLAEIKAILEDGNVTAEELAGLAKALTMFSSTTIPAAYPSLANTSLAAPYNSFGSNLNEVRAKFNININWDSHITTIGNDKVYNWQGTSTDPFEVQSQRGQKPAVTAINNASPQW